MNAFNGYKKYQEIQYSTSDQGSLILLSYDSAIRFCKAAKECLNENDSSGRGIWLTKAFDLVSELRKSLRIDVGGETAESLNKAYEFIGHQITLANIFNKSEHINHALLILTSLRDAWREIIPKERKRQNL